MIRLWTDGCCLENPGGIGGWAVVAERNGEVLWELSGDRPSTTNNRMEMEAAIQAIMQSPGSAIEVLSDSTYLVKGVQLWMPRWKELNWRRGNKHVKNAEMWKKLDRLITAYPSKLRFRWVKGHMGNPFNEMADQLASETARASANA